VLSSGFVSLRSGKTPGHPELELPENHGCPEWHSFAKQFKVGLAITIIEETRLTIIATLRDVLGNFSNIEAWRPWQRLVRD
jgi:hypothetical protein